MSPFWLLLVVGVSLLGCGKTPVAKEAAQVNADVLNLQQADAAFSVSTNADATKGASVAVREGAPSVVNAVTASVVDNTEAGPLVDASISTAGAKAVKDVSVLSGETLDVSENPDGELIQRVLKYLGLYDGAIDGKIGPRTKEAISEFQKQNDLSVDGKVGPKTWALLKKALERAPAVAEVAAPVKKK